MEINNESNKIKKDILKTCMLIHIGVLTSILISKHYGDIAFMVVNMLLFMLNVNMANRELIMSIFKVGIKLFPIFPFIAGEIKLYDLVMQYNELKIETINYLYQMQELKFEKDKITVLNMVEKMETLPRSKQIELLNYAKDLIHGNNTDKGKYLDLELLSKDGLDLFVSEVGDMVYPSFDSESEKGYTRKKIKDDN